MPNRKGVGLSGGSLDNLSVMDRMQPLGELILGSGGIAEMVA